MLEIPFYWVDSFTSKPFGGGATIVCTLDEKLDDETLSKIAKETGVLESAFAMKKGENEYDLKWYGSNGYEAHFAGYATLATTHVLVSEHDEKAPIQYNTISGKWTGDFDGENYTVFLPLRGDFESVDFPKIAELLGVENYVEILHNAEYRVYCVLLDNQEMVSGLSPDQCEVDRFLNSIGYRAVIATSRGDIGFDFAYRLFIRGREDYACGSALAGLSPYWSEKLGKGKLRSIQPHCRVSIVESAPLENGVKITSKARILVKGTMYL
jgi:PhzF family phenazine biosynthesis protein